MPKLVDLKVLREEAEKVRRAEQRLEQALAESNPNDPADRERFAVVRRGDLYYRATERFARMTIRWLDATDPLRAQREAP